MLKSGLIIRMRGANPDRTPQKPPSSKMDVSEIDLSMVEYLYVRGGPIPYKCGYCKSPDTSYTRGVWGYKMTCQDFQDLVDFGFQRSGNFVYKPVMKQTCCPQYVIRLDAKKFKLSKSQKSSIKKFKRYLLEGRESPVEPHTGSHGNVATTAHPESHDDTTSTPVGNCMSTASASETTPSCSTSQGTVLYPGSKKVKKVVKPGTGPDPNKPPCKKAKVIRKERREQKLLTRVQQDIPHANPSTHTINSQVSSNHEFNQYLEEILTFPKHEDCIHKFKMKLLAVNSKEFTDTYEESFQVFKKFQTIIHKETETDSGEKQFNEFLVCSPLRYKPGPENMTIQFGTYHQQYLLDDKIFAVGVLDILPKGVLCEYLYYDPDYRFIAPGVITALLEISLTQQFYLQNPAMQYYYMGYYVQSCPKMNYKSKYGASALLCPETYTYVPIATCIPKLKASGYSRLAAEDAENPHTLCTEDSMQRVPIKTDMTIMSYATYTTLHGNTVDELIKEYITLVGSKVAFNMMLCFSRVVS